MAHTVQAQVDKDTKKKEKKKRELETSEVRHNALQASITSSLGTAVCNLNVMDMLKQLKAEVALTNTRASEDSVNRLKLEATIAKKKLESYRTQIELEKQLELEKRQGSASRGSYPPRLDSLCSSLLTVFTQERLRVAASIPQL